MKIFKGLLYAFFIWLNLTQLAFGQELNCVVSVDANRLETGQVSERAIFTDMQKAITNFLNNQKWSKDEYKNVEQINCRLNITLQRSPEQNVFEGTAQIKSSRPVYNTTYETTLLNFNDQSFSFRYVQGQPLFFQENAFTDNLTAILAFYAYAVLALDYDSFSKAGGNPYVEKLYNLVNIAQSGGGSGWVQTSNQVNRYWLAENLQSQQMIPFRESLYTYHRLGLDTYLIDPEKSRQAIMETLEAIVKVNKVKPSAAFTNIFFDAKYQEIVHFFKDATPEIKKKVRDIIAPIDPGHTKEYDKLVN